MILTRHTGPGKSYRKGTTPLQLFDLSPSNRVAEQFLETNHWGSDGPTYLTIPTIRWKQEAMKLKNIKITDFKHFTSLKVKNLPRSARLIVLVGPNGCGKSSFIEAIHIWYRWKSLRGIWDEDYHHKRATESPFSNFDDFVQIISHDPIPEDRDKMLYIRSAYRNEPEFQTTQLSRLPDRSSESRIDRLIDHDPAVSTNYARMSGRALKDIFTDEDRQMSLGDFTTKILGDIRSPFNKMFPELYLDDFGDPLEDGTFRFTKGISRGYLYKNLSGGERAAFDLILDLVLAIRTFDDTVFCIDEPELHMNAQLQNQLLKVLYELIPENSQLIVATHSIGMIRQAKDIEKSNPGSVVFLDFTDLNFDLPQQIEPSVPSRDFWKKAYSVALDDLAELVAPECVVICEGEPRKNKSVTNHSFDAQCYEQIFKAEFPETQFISAGNDNAVKSDILIAAIGKISEKIRVIRVIDRDDRTPSECMELKNKGVRVLSERNLETYLYDDKVLEKLAESVGKPNSLEKLLSAKCRIIAETTNLKDVAGQIYNECKTILELQYPGSNHKAFERDTLSPLIQKGMNVYSRLRDDIFGEL